MIDCTQMLCEWRETLLRAISSQRSVNWQLRRSRERPVKRTGNRSLWTQVTLSGRFCSLHLNSNCLSESTCRPASCWLNVFSSLFVSVICDCEWWTSVKLTLNFSFFWFFWHFLISWNVEISTDSTTRSSKGHLRLTYCQHSLHRQTLLLVGSHAAFGTVSFICTHCWQFH